MSLDKKTLDDLRIHRTAAPGRRSAGAIVVIVVVLLVIGALAYGWYWRSVRQKPIQVQTVSVQAPSTSTGGKTLLNASGYVTARRAATVSSKVTGKVVEVMVEEGMRVEAGQVLAKIDSSNVERSLHLAEAQAESARAALGETRANLVQAERELRRVTELAASKVASQADLDKADADHTSLKARLERQQAEVTVADREVTIWKQQLDDTIIRAPFSGIVTSKNAQPGEMISPMSAGGSFTRTGICTLVDMSSLEIEVDVNESFITRVQPGQPVEATLDAYPEWHIPAKVIAIIPTADRQKATVKVRIGFDKLDPRILPDMSVKAAFQSGDEPKAAKAAISIPKTAVQRRDNQDVVWIVRDNRVERRAVTVASARGDEAEITAGLSGGEKIVVNPPAGLAEGAAVSEGKE